MSESERKKRIKILVQELVTFNVEEQRESDICFEIDNLSPDPKWSNYIFWTDDYIDEEDNFLMEKFLDKIFSYKENIIHL